MYFFYKARSSLIVLKFVMQDTVFMPGLVFLVATWNFWKSYKKGYAVLVVLHLLSLMNPWLIVEI